MLYYIREVDQTMLTPLGFIAAQKSNLTEKLMQKLKQLLDYAASHKYAIITYQASGMVLAGHINASYLPESKVQSRVGGNLFMSNNTAFPPNNGEVFTMSKPSSQSYPQHQRLNW